MASRTRDESGTRERWKAFKVDPRVPRSPLILAAPRRPAQTISRPIRWWLT